MNIFCRKRLFFSWLVMLLCFGITSLSYSQAVVSVDPVESSSPAVGSQLTIRLKVTNARNVVAYEAGVNFDTSALRYVSSTNGSYLPTGAFFAPPQVSGGRVTVTATSVSGAVQATSGTLASVTFSVVAVKESTIRLTDVILSDSKAKPLAVTTKNGSIIERRGVKWDVNADGQVNVLDLVLVAKSLGSQNARADANGDGTINVLDLVTVAKHLGGPTGGGVTPPPVTTPPVTTRPVTPPSSTEGMVLIPAGEFQIGSNAADAKADEKPVRTVYVDAFYMDETEVTNAQFKEFLAENPRWQKGRIDRRFHDGNYLYHWSGNNYPSGKGNHPVVYMGWYAAMAYAEWADKRLPTEAEWERAARGGLVGNKYPHGNTITRRDANYGSTIKGTTDVRSYPANAYGLYDMAGNVFEWCLDEKDKDFYATFPPNGVARNPLSGASSVKWLLDNFTTVRYFRVLRGGSWYHDRQLARVTFRLSHLPTLTANSLGFRCVKDVSP